MLSQAIAGAILEAEDKIDAKPVRVLLPVCLIPQLVIELGYRGDPGWLIEGVPVVPTFLLANYPQYPTFDWGNMTLHGPHALDGPITRD